MPGDFDSILQALAKARRALLAERNAAGHWEGELSTSALSTATAVVALHQADAVAHAGLIAGGLRWIAENRNPDHGWGDTVKSASNLSTTLLCWSALHLDPSPEAASIARKAECWIRDYVGSLDPGKIVETVSARYGKDRTFSVPILMLCALCGRLGKNPWRRVLPLPFELAVLPRRWFAALRLPVVSYALPALIAIGRARFYHAPPLGLFRLIRQFAWPKASRLLKAIQPSSGGFLEAAPLTSFVAMALASTGEKNHPVVARAVDFLKKSVRPDGSWPIDTNLATWVTTLAVKALRSYPVGSAGQEGMIGDETLSDPKPVLDWLLAQQGRERHPFTDAAPGGWAWTDLPGGVPDADDTPGALLALRLLSGAEHREAAERGVTWLLDLQNRDGGIPTFCQGWGALPFDRSSPDLTAHTLRAWLAWEGEMPGPVRARIAEGARRALAYLMRQQRADGSWTPLWFGNQHLRRDEENPVYGTAMVLRALIERESDLSGPECGGLRRGLAWLLANQNADGGWGAGSDTPSSIEETTLALETLAASPLAPDAVMAKGAEWLIAATRGGTVFEAAPIGFYFAKLWYFERLYPLIWAVGALGAVVKRLGTEKEN